MNTAEEFEKVSELVKAWFAGDSNGAMHDACTDEPELAWGAIVEILKRELTEDQKALLAAGPLEDLLVHHGSRCIERVEQEAQRNARFNYMLGGFWRREIPQEVWQLVEKARNVVW